MADEPKAETLPTKAMVEAGASASRSAREGWVGAEALGRTQRDESHPDQHSIDIAIAKAVWPAMEATRPQGEPSEAGPELEAVMRAAAFRSTEHQYDLAAPTDTGDAVERVNPHKLCDDCGWPLYECECKKPPATGDAVERLRAYARALVHSFDIAELRQRCKDIETVLAALTLPDKTKELVGALERAREDLKHLAAKYDEQEFVEPTLRKIIKALEGLNHD